MKRSAWISALLLSAIAALGLRLGMSSASARPARGQGTTLEAGLVGAAEARTRSAIESLAERERAATRRQQALDSHIRKMPDITQTDPELGVVGGGDSWCGPAAVSNALMWLAENGRETLAPAGVDEHQRQLELVRRLGSSRYMGTTPNGGTGTANLLTGLHKYLRDTGWGYQRLQYEGWRGHPSRFTTRVRAAELGFLTKGLSDGGVAVIHAGWYTPSRFGDFYRRHGGHWLTVVGAGIDADGNPAPDTFVVHDPAPYAGTTPARSFVKVEALEHGWLLAEDGAFPAKGYLRLAGGMRIKVDGDIAVLDGAVVLVP